MSSSLHSEPTHSIAQALDTLADLPGFANVYVAVESGAVRHGVYSAMRASPQLIFCMAGQATYWLRRSNGPTRVVLNAGDAIVLPGGVWIAVDPEQHYRTFGVSLFPEMTHCYLVQPGSVGEPHPFGGQSRSFAELADNEQTAGAPAAHPRFERIDYLDELDRPTSSDPTTEHLIATLALNAERASTDAILGCLLKALVLRVRESMSTTSAASTSRAEATFIRIKRYVIANCDQPIDRSRIAEAIGVHPRHVSNLFKRFGDETLSQFLLRARLERARRLLATSKSSVSELSDICGFSSSNYFVRAFRQRFGTPPGRYREAKYQPTDAL